MLDRRLLTVLVLIGGCRGREATSSSTTAPPVAPPREAALHAVASSIRATESAGVAAAMLDERSVVFVADADDRAVLMLDAKTSGPISRVELGSPPRDLLVLERGVVLATLPEANAIAVIETTGPRGELRVARRISTSTEPLAMAVSLDGKKVAVTAGAGHRVDVLSAESLSPATSHDVPREPRAVLFGADGTLFVTHATQDALTTLADGGTKRIGLGINRGSFDERGSEPPRHARHANALVRVADKLFVPLVQTAPKNGAPPGGGYGGESDFGWGKMPMPQAFDDPFDGRRVQEKKVEPTGPLNRMSSFDVRVVDAAGAKLADEADRSPGRMPDLLRSCLLPRAAVAVSPARILVACSGESSVIELEAKSGYPHVTRTIAVPRGPAAIARVDDAHVVVWSPLARELSRFATDGQTGFVRHEIPRQNEIDPKIVAGRELFTRTGDPRISKDGLACASCHPDGRDDGLVWQTPLGERRPRTLAGNAARTTRFGWGAEQPTIEKHVTQTLKRLRGTGLPEEELDSIFAYLRSLPPVPTADLPSEPDALRGAQVFASDRAACATCHEPENGFTDNRAHVLGYGELVVTPSLAGIGSRARIFHDGRFASFEQMFEGQYSQEYFQPMGGIPKLSPDERRDLAAYLRTL